MTAPPRSAGSGSAPGLPTGYLLHERLEGHGGDVLYRCRRARDGLAVLVRMPPAPLAASAAEERYRRELALARLLASPHVNPVLAVESAGGRVALVQEDFGGSALAGQIPPGGLPLDEALDIALALARGLGALHEHGFVHGGLAPRRVFVNRASRLVRLVDLSTCARLDDPRDERRPRPPAAAALEYVSPEQTGRTDHAVDHRSDLYALGVLLFELLCGRRPFVADDPLEIVHGHLARLAPRAAELRPDVPPALSDLTAKLLAKDPRSRYQSSAGLAADLGAIRQAVARGDQEVRLALGSQDLPRRLRFPERLYGREEDLRALEAALEQAARGATALVLVGGYAGVGKSSLIAQMQRPTEERGGLFAWGKFDQLGRNVAYGAIRKACGALLGQVVEQGEAAVALARRRLLDALDHDAAVLADLVPELESLLGPSPPVEPLDPVQAQHRFTRVFQAFLGVFAGAGRPLVLVLDDLQWADPESLQLVEVSATSPDLRGLLVIGAYRDNEVDAAHPALLMAERVGAAGTPVGQITLAPLCEPDVVKLVAEALDEPPATCAPLAALVYERAEGNPFFAKSFLQNLHEVRLLSSHPDGGWAWDMEAIRAAPSARAGGVLELMAARLGRLAEATRRVLCVAACLGAVFDLETLAAAAGEMAESVLGWLEPALVAGLVVRAGPIFRFLHDRTQEAAYALMRPEEREPRHLTIGRRLLSRASPEELPRRVVEIVGHLNAGRRLLQPGPERQQVASLNLEAARRLHASAAYTAAAAHAAVGVELLPDDRWSSCYELSFELCALWAECNALSGDFAQAERLYPEMEAAARSDLDRIRVYMLEMAQAELQGRYLDAVALIRRGLALVGVHAFPDDEEEQRRDLARELSLIPVHLAGRSIADLPDAPPMTDPVERATLRLLMNLWSPCYVTGLQTLFALVSVKMANFSLQHGNSELTSAAYVSYSFVAGFLTGDYASAYAFGRAGIALSERYQDRSVRARCYFLFGVGTNLWRQPMRTSNRYLEGAYELGLSSGNLPYAGYASHYIVCDSYLQGRPLHEVAALHEQHLAFQRRAAPVMAACTEASMQSMRALAGLPAFDEAAFLERFRRIPMFLAAYYFGKLQAAYLFDDPAAGEYAERALELVPRDIPGTLKVPETWFYAALIALAGAAAAPDREARRARAAGLSQQLEELARNAPSNFRHKHLLVEAEIARADGHLERALALYEEAQADAEAAGLAQDAALAAERAGRFLLERGLRRPALAYLIEAQAGYRRWGAAAKAEQLGWLQGDPGEGRAAEGPALALPASEAALDLRSVAKASQAISREMDLDRLIARLLQLCLENAGARRGALILLAAGRPEVAAVVRAEGLRVERRASEPLAASEDVSAAIVSAALASGGSVVLHDALREGAFTADPHVVRSRARSVLCTPIRHQDAVVGALYLENELIPGAFGPMRSQVLDLLAGQAAISLENARLYSELRQLEQELRRRVEELARADRRKDDFLAMLGHELRNPLSPILMAVGLMRMRPGRDHTNERAMIERQVHHLVRLVDELLDVARITRGRVHLQRSRLDLADVVANGCEIAGGLVQERGHRLSADVPRGLWVNGDPVRLSQVVANLVSNAAKYTESGGAIDVKAGREGGQVWLTVRDTGIGIDRDLLPEVFELFVQGDRRLDRAQGGLGLGLTIVRSLVEGHGGTVTADSEGVGRGAEFTVRLPAAEVASAAEAVAPPIAAGEGATAGEASRPAAVLRVLIIDDNHDAAEGLAEVLRAMGHEAHVVYDGEAAIEAARRLAPDLALVDIGLPIVDGYEVARRLRAMPEGRRLRLVAVTGYGQPSDRRRAKAAGFDDHLVKPVSIEVVEAAVRAVAA
ncbi:AAA family ATPase [Sorangium sp. So ce134]